MYMFINIFSKIKIVKLKELLLILIIFKIFAVFLGLAILNNRIVVIFIYVSALV